MSTNDYGEEIIPVTVRHDITLRDVAYLLCSAFEGGVGYWAQIVGYVEPKTPVAHMDIGGDKTVYPYVDFPLTPDGAVLIRDVEEDGQQPDEGEPDEGKTWRLDYAAVAKGLQVMADKYHKHFHTFLDENGDAETGDVFLQCCLFGEIVYS